MGLVLLLIAAVLFVPPFYQKKYFAEYNTITKGKAFAYPIILVVGFIFIIVLKISGVSKTRA